LVILDAGEHVGEVLDGLILRASARTKLAVVEDPESEPRVRLYDAGDGALDPAA
jgi:hypothetical protein